MKPTLTQGLTTSRRITVDEKRTIGFMGEEGRVYATPELVRDIEMTCREFLLEHADAGEDSVGMRVEITARVAEVKGRVITFEVTARDSLDEICKGRHVRFVADTAKSKERIAAKRAKAKAA